MPLRAPSASLLRRLVAAARPALLAAGAAAVVGAAACAPADARPPRPHGLVGTVLPQAVARPAFTLADTDGAPFDFAARTGGQVTLLFFGYTHCPDVCPVHLANIARALQRLSYDDRQRVRVVFVSTDPERDTPERIREWLDGFDPSFVGLRGPLPEVNRIQRTLGLGAAAPVAGTEGVLPDSGYLVGHAGQVLAFTPDDSAHVAYPFGTRQADWAADLPILLAGVRW